MSDQYGHGQEWCLIKIEHEKGTFYMSVESGDLWWVYQIALLLLREAKMSPPRSMTSLRMYSEGGDNTISIYRDRDGEGTRLPGSSERWVSMAGKGWWEAAGQLAQYEGLKIMADAWVEQEWSRLEGGNPKG